MSQTIICAAHHMRRTLTGMNTCGFAIVFLEEIEPRRSLILCRVPKFLIGLSTNSSRPLSWPLTLVWVLPSSVSPVVLMRKLALICSDLCMTRVLPSIDSNEGWRRIWLDTATLLMHLGIFIRETSERHIRLLPTLFKGAELDHYLKHRLERTTIRFEGSTDMSEGRLEVEVRSIPPLSLASCAELVTTKIAYDYAYPSALIAFLQACKN